VAEGRALVTIDLDFANPLRFPPQDAAGIAVPRVRDRPGRGDLDAVVKQLVAALETTDIRAHLWVVAPSRVRQYVAGDG
jgi:hypothetical protein